MTALCATLASDARILHVNHLYFYSEEILREALGNLNKCNMVINFLFSMFSTSEYVHFANHNEPTNSFPVGQNSLHIHSEKSY